MGRVSPTHRACALTSMLTIALHPVLTICPSTFPPFSIHADMPWVLLCTSGRTKEQRHTKIPLVSLLLTYSYAWPIQYVVILFLVSLKLVQVRSTHPSPKCKGPDYGAYLYLCICHQPYNLHQDARTNPGLRSSVRLLSLACRGERAHRVLGHQSDHDRQWARGVLQKPGFQSMDLHSTLRDHYDVESTSDSIAGVCTP